MNGSPARLPRVRRRAAILIACAFPLSCLGERRAAEPPRMPGPAPQAARPGDIALENARCEGCHADIAREWRASMHAQASVDPVYQRALAIEPLPFCRGCHAPEADPSRAPRH